jgi:hypothetical protein
MPPTKREVSKSSGQQSETMPTPNDKENVRMGLQTRPKRPDLKVRPYSLETEERPRQWVELVQLILLCFSYMYN